MPETKPDMPADRLKRARIDAGFRSAAAFADANNLTEVTYRSAENGTRGLTLANAKAWAPLLGVSWQWLMDGSAPHGAESAPAAPNAENEGELLHRPLTERQINDRVLSEINIDAMPRTVPIYGSGIVGDDGLFLLNVEPIDYARRPPRLAAVKDAYALYLATGCMSPWRESGQKVYVHPHLTPQPGDYVVVQLKQESPGGPFPAYIKKLVRRSAAEVRLLQFEPREEKSIPTRRIHAIHKILDWDELLGL